MEPTKIPNFQHKSSVQSTNVKLTSFPRKQQQEDLTPINYHEKDYPQKKIKTQLDMALWQKSKAYFYLVKFITALSECIRNKKLSDPVETTDVIDEILNTFKQLKELIQKHPPVQQPSRYGNIAFRSWFKAMCDVGDNLMKKIVSKQVRTCLLTYL